MKKLLLILGILGLIPPERLPGQTPEPVVHAIFFFSPSCPHCHDVIAQNLIPLQNQYGNRLVILGMDTSQPWAYNLYWEAIRDFKVPQDEWAVPFLLVGDEVLVGGAKIPSRFPTIIEEGLAAGGIDLPDYPALVTFLQEKQLLDPRYPDRLIALQAPAPAPEEEEPQSVEPPPGDSVVMEDPMPAEESGAVGDSALAQDSAAVEDATVVEDAAGVEDTAVVEDSTVVRGDDPSDTLPVDTTGAIPDPGVAAGETGSGIEGPGPEEAQDTAVPESLPGSAVSSVPDSPLSEARDSAAETLGTLGLAEAARRLESLTMWDRFNLDRTGSSLSVLVLLGMVVSLILRGYPPRVRGREWPSWVLPTLVSVGVGVAAYLSFIEVTQTQAVCGPVGDCNTVNQSKYAFLFGVLPVGVLGLVGYGVILVLWVLGRSGSGSTPRMAALGIWAAALLGTLFSVYLTFLEPFVIGATCAWCLTSAVVMTLLLWATSPMAARVWPTGSPASSPD